MGKTGIPWVLQDPYGNKHTVSHRAEMGWNTCKLLFTAWNSYSCESTLRRSTITCVGWHQAPYVAGKMVWSHMAGDALRCSSKMDYCKVLYAPVLYLLTFSTSRLLMLVSVVAASVVVAVVSRIDVNKCWNKNCKLLKCIFVKNKNTFTTTVLLYCSGNGDYLCRGWRQCLNHIHRSWLWQAFDGW